MRILPAALLMLVVPAASAAPISIAHSGYLLDGSDGVVTGSRSLVFRLFDHAAQGDAGDTQIWTSNACTLDVHAGYYTTVLGASCTGALPLEDSHVPVGQARYLEVVVGGVTLVPRLALATAPTAAAAASLSCVGCVSTGQVAAGAITRSRLANDGCADGQYLAWSDASATWACTTLPAAPTLNALLPPQSASKVLATNGTTASWISYGTGGNALLQLDATGRLPALDGSALTNLNASNFGSGTLPGAQLSGTYPNALTLSSTSNTFSGNGAGLTALNASNLASGTLPSGRLSGTYASALAFSNTGNTFAGDGSALTNLSGASLATGTVADARLPTSMTGKTFTSSLDLTNHTIVNVADPSNAQDAATKNYVDTHTSPTSTPPSRQILTSGSGTYTTPANAKRLLVRMVGGGGAGGTYFSGCTTNNGTATTFGGWGANGGGAGAGGTSSTTAAAAGGSGGSGGTNGSGAQAVRWSGGFGSTGGVRAATALGGSGAGSFFGGATGGGSNTGAGQSASANTGAGGGGFGGYSSSGGGGGGGSGEYVELFFTNPASSYAFTVGTGGIGGTTACIGATGSNGGSGIIIVDEYY